MLGLFVMILYGTINVIISVFFFLIVLCTAVTLPNFYDLTRIFLDYFLQNLVGFFVQNHVCNQFPAQGPPED
jgi:hypothetical protein